MSSGPDSTEVIWNDVECGGYEADLPLWEELAAEHSGPILELGCGSGRVTLRLAEKTEELVLGVDHDPDLVAAVWARAHGHAGDAEVGDVRAFEFACEFRLALAPMQLIQLLPERADRTCCLACVADHLAPGGVAAFAVLEEEPEVYVDEASPPSPDVRQVGEWVYSSLPLPPHCDEDSIVVRRLRQVVSPEGSLREDLSEIHLQKLSAATLEAEAAELGLQPLGRREIPASSDHVGSTVVLLEKEA
jgi:SAM-dependent methyltransferase